MVTTVDRLTTALADRCRIERELGQGGMATVYLAHDLKHDRRVAVKVLRPELAESLGHERFLREITTTANLRHPHILPLYDSGEVDGFVYYVMPYVEGESLRDRLDREKQLPLDDATQITTEAADALGYAHGRGVIHRDIKPENILLEGGHAVVADFGIARAVRVSGASSLTQTGMAIGTPAYMSPEQAAGEQDLDGRSDLYALGCVTYEMLAGQPPFTGPTVESIVHQHLAAEPRPVTHLRTSLPGAVSDALLRVLAKNRVDRFATASAFTDALRSAASDRTGEKPSAARRGRRVASLTIAALAVAGVAAFAWSRLRGSRDDARLDPNVIAVLPFRVGGNSSIAYLRESMLDLLQSRLSSSTGPRTVEPRTMLAAWRRAAKNDSDDLPEDQSREIARAVGAGRVLLGSIVTTPTELTLNGTLVRVGDGSILARESVSSTPDSIAVLVNRLTAALLIGEAGEDRDRRAGLAAAPLEALQDYLAGRKAARHGDYFGAMDLFGRAVARDSTFVDAAFAMIATNTWIGTVYTTAGYAMIPLVSRLRDRLSARDRALFLALPAIGPNFPRPSTHAEIIAQAEQAANDASDSPEHWLLLGQLLAHYGAAASQSNWPARSAAALDRAIALDSSFTAALGDRLFTAMLAHDRAATTRVAALLEARVASGFTDDMLLWAAARSLGDSAAAIRWRDRKEGLSRADYVQKLTKIPLHSAAFALPLDDARWAVRELTREATTPSERGGVSLVDLAVRFAAGRGTAGTERVDAYGPGWAATLIEQGVIEPAYRSIAGAAVAHEAAGGYRLPTAGGTTRWLPVEFCFAELYRVTGGDTSGTREAVRRLRAFATLDPPPGLAQDEWRSLEMRVCPLLLEVLLERPPTAGTRWARLDELDALMRDGPRWFAAAGIVSPSAFANYTVARLREAQGDMPGALAAIRRREVDYFPAYLWSLPAFLRQEGRLAARSGDRAGAIRAYDEYLTLRTDPDAPLEPQRDSVLAERAALGAGRR
jgi:serine/threonine protein kinase